MKKSRFTESQIVSILKQSDAGVPVKDICRQAGISVPTYCQWKSKYSSSWAWRHHRLHRQFLMQLTSHQRRTTLQRQVRTRGRTSRRSGRC